MSKRVGSAGENSRVSVDPSSANRASASSSIGKLNQGQEALFSPRNSRVPRNRPPRNRRPSSTPSMAEMHKRNTKVADGQDDVAASQSSTDDQACIPIKLKLIIGAIIASALTMTVTTGLGIAPFTAIIAMVVFFASVAFLINYMREAFAETEKALGKIEEMKDELDDLGNQVEAQQKLIVDAGEIIKDQQTTLQRAGNEAKSAYEQASVLEAKLQAQLDTLTGAEAQAVDIVERLGAYANVAERLAQTALAQVNANMGQALDLLGDAERGIGEQIQGMQKRVNEIFKGINSLVEQQKRILSAGLAEYEKNKEGNPKAVTQLLEVVEQTLVINDEINEILRNLQDIVNEELNELQRIVNAHIGQLRNQLQEAQRQLREANSKVEGLKAQRAEVETQLAVLKGDNEIALAKNIEITEGIAALKGTLDTLNEAIAASENDRERAAETLGKILDNSDGLISNIEEVQGINGKIEKIVKNTAVELGWGRRFANMAGAAVGGVAGGAIAPIAGVAGGAAAGALAGNAIYNFLRHWI